VVALIGNCGAHGSVREALEAEGLSPELFDEVDDLALDASPALVVMCVDGTLSRAVGRELDRLRAAVGEAPIVIVCAAIRAGELRVALAAGADAVVLGEDLAATLAPSLAAVRAGQVCVPRRHARQVEPAALSAREKQILGLVVMGYMNGQIAERLFVAESTVKSHLSSAFGKLGVRSRNEAVDLILDSERGLGMGILGLGGEPVETIAVGQR
jgi:DNA-binding NarL/FixJ family response regulator